MSHLFWLFTTHPAHSLTLLGYAIVGFRDMLITLMLGVLIALVVQVIFFSNASPESGLFFLFSFGGLMGLFAMVGTIIAANIQAPTPHPIKYAFVHTLRIHNRTHTTTITTSTGITLYWSFAQHPNAPLLRPHATLVLDRYHDPLIHPYIAWHALSSQ